MYQVIYRIRFAMHVSFDEVEMTALLALWAIESLHGESQTRLDTCHFLDSSKRVCIVDARTNIGRDFSRVLFGFLRREFGTSSFAVEKVPLDEKPGAPEGVP